MSPRIDEYAYTFAANVEPPLVLDDPASASWADTADVVVVGFGGAGAVTAIQAQEDGGTALIVERFGPFGGATAKSGGVVYAGGTRYLKEAGYDDTAEEMYKYLRHEGTPVGDDTLRRFCETSSSNIDWLVSQGVRFGASPYEERTAYPPDGYFLYYTGMEKFSTEIARPAPRGHRTVGKGPTGKDYFPPLRDAALSKGAKLVHHAPVRRLVLERSGQVIGVEAQIIPTDLHAHHDKLYSKVDPYKLFNGALAEEAIAECTKFEKEMPQHRALYRARKGVVLASGGFNYNLELSSRFKPVFKRAYKEIVRGGAMGCSGSGIELGITVGGKIDLMENMFVTKGVSPPHAFVHGVLVNLQGKRFVPEDGYAGTTGVAISEQSEDGTAWLILDSTTFWAGFRQLTWPPKNMLSWWGLPAFLSILFAGTKRASSINELANKLGIDSRILSETMDTYNANAATGTDPLFNKLSQHIKAQHQAPYFAVNMSLRNKWSLSGCMPFGGLTIDEHTGAVTRADGSIIPGLYAAGRTAIGVCSGKKNFSGLSIADTVFSGRRAARAALQRNAARQDRPILNSNPTAGVVHESRH